MGTAVAMHLARAGNDTVLWASEFDRRVLPDLIEQRRHPALPEHLPESLSVLGDEQLEAAADGIEIAIMGATSAVEILYRRQLAQVEEPERDALRAKLAAEHELMAGSVAKAMKIGVVDEIIDPAETRCRIGQLLAAAATDRGRHRNIPL